MRVTVEFVGVIQRGDWAQVQEFPELDSGTMLEDFLVRIGYEREHLRHIIVVRNDAITQDLATELLDGDRLKLSVLLGGG